MIKCQESYYYSDQPAKKSVDSLRQGSRLMSNNCHVTKGAYDTSFLFPDYELIFSRDDKEITFASKCLNYNRFVFPEVIS